MGQSLVIAATSNRIVESYRKCLCFLIVPSSFFGLCRARQDIPYFGDEVLIERSTSRFHKI